MVRGALNYVLFITFIAFCAWLYGCIYIIFLMGIYLIRYKAFVQVDLLKLNNEHN